VRVIAACLVHVSTDFVFDGQLNAAPTATMMRLIRSRLTDQSKLLGETELQHHAPADWLIVRTAWVYGRHGGNFPRTMVTAARAGKPLAVDR
jgi:dTDP-4-dehydrorhamnose reductase